MSNISLDSNGWNQIILTLNGSVMELFLNCTSVMLINNIDPEFPYSLSFFIQIKNKNIGKDEKRRM